MEHPCAEFYLDEKWLLFFAYLHGNTTFVNEKLCTLSLNYQKVKGDISFTYNFLLNKEVTVIIDISAVAWKELKIPYSKHTNRTINKDTSCGKKDHAIRCKNIQREIMPFVLCVRH
jgi:hypothetical protein